MSWTDKIAFNNILQLKKNFNINTAVITGTGKGGDAELYGHHFETVHTVEIDYETYQIAQKRLAYLKNVRQYFLDSAYFLRVFKKVHTGNVLYYLDAHYYDPLLSQKWVVVRELQSLIDCNKAIIVIHDYDNGLFGHLVYAGEHMGWNVIGEHIQKVNSDFSYYTNNECSIYNETTVHEMPIKVDLHIVDGIRYANSSPIKRERGILYATPKPIDLTKYKLKEGHG